MVELLFKLEGKVGDHFCYCKSSHNGSLLFVSILNLHSNSFMVELEVRSLDYQIGIILGHCCKSLMAIHPLTDETFPSASTPCSTLLKWAVYLKIQRLVTVPIRQRFQAIC